MDVNGGSTADGAAVIQWSSNGGTNQQWSLHRTGDNVYTVTGAGSGKCLEVPNSSTSQGTDLDIRTRTGGTNQAWAFEATGSYTSSANASYVLVNLNSGLAADVTSGSTTAGAKIEQWPVTGGGNQTWTLG